MRLAAAARYCSRTAVRSSGVSITPDVRVSCRGPADSPIGGIGISRVWICARTGAPQTAIEPTVAMINTLNMATLS
jgi:hypothetical protein